MSKMYNLPNISSLYIKLCELEEKKTHIACVYNIPWITITFSQIRWGANIIWSHMKMINLVKNAADGS